MAGRWFSLGTPVSSTNKTDHHDITEILLKVALRTINQTNQTKSKRLTIFLICGYVFSRESVIVGEGQTPEEPDGMYHNLLCIHLLVRLSKVKNITITKHYNYKNITITKT